MTHRHDPRQQAIEHLKAYDVLMVDGHFDYGNGFHGRVYLNPHRIFRQPSLIWRFAQDVIEILPESIVRDTEVVAGPIMGGALLAHTIAGLLDGRRALNRPATSFAPLSSEPDGALKLRPFYQSVVEGKRVLLADDVRNTGKTLERAQAVIAAAGGNVIATVQIYDRLEAIVDLHLPNFALAEYRAPDNYPVDDCPLCRSGIPIATF